MNAPHKGHPQEKPYHPHLILGGLLWAFVFALGLYSVHDEATWLHIQTGARIIAEGGLPRVDPFSYTAAGRAWTTSSWLADTLFFLVHSGFGPQGLVLLKSAVLAAGFALLLPLNPSSPLLGAAVLGLGAFAAWPGFAETPAAFDFLLLALMLRLLRPRSRFRWGLPLQAAIISCLWANLHGATAGLALWLAAVKVFKTSLRSTAKEGLSYVALLAGALAGFSLNPHGLGLLAQGLAVPEAWTTPWADVQGWASLYGLFVAAGLAASWVCLQQEFVLTVTSATLLGLSLLLPSLRPLALLGVCPVISLALGHAMLPVEAKAGRVARLGLGLTALFLLHWVAVYEPMGAARGYRALSFDGALEFLRANGVKGRVFNDPEAGSYLIGGGRAVFVDGRASLYGASFAADARDWPLRFPSLHQVYDFDYAVLVNRRAAYPAKALDESPDWLLAYADDASLVYLNRKGADGWLVHSLPAATLTPNRLWPDRLDGSLRQPGRLSKLMGELDRWIVQAPDSVEALLWKAYALDRMKLAPKAERLLALAEARPTLRRDPELLALLAYVHESAGRTQGAAALYARAASLARRRADGLLEAGVLARLGPLHRKLGEESRAAADERRAGELTK